MATPTVPQRPARLHNILSSSSPSIDLPRVPPRPKRSVERSISPNRDTFARSPLNDPSFLPLTQKTSAPSSLGRSTLGPQDVPARPPSVTLPSVGQEGNEYAHLEHGEESDTGAAEQTKMVSGDLPLHAPKASLPVSTAKSRIAAVTRTDSSSAAAAGIGKPSSESGHASSHLGFSITRSSSSQQSRPSSLFKPDSQEPEVGIPEIGMQIPLYKNAGDVQAPTPTGSSVPPSTGIGFFNKGDQPSRHHARTRSGREIFNGPPGSYGLHGHGVNQRDPFEKAWYQKHPDQLVREAQGEYGPAIQEHRKDYTMSSTELNKLIREEDNGKLHDCDHISVQTNLIPRHHWPSRYSR
jgi:Altered inheritance of mitochondria protein 21